MMFFFFLGLSLVLFLITPWWSFVILGFLGGLLSKKFVGLWKTVFTPVFLSGLASLFFQIYRFDDFRDERISGLLSLPHPMFAVLLSALVFSVLSLVSAWFFFELKKIFSQ